jgi:hypothetical protein
MQRPPRSRFREKPAAVIFEALENEPALLRLECTNKSATAALRRHHESADQSTRKKFDGS